MIFLILSFGNCLHSYRIIALGKVARHVFPLTGTIPHVANAGDIFYLVSLMVGILLWGFALVWFIVAMIMIATAYPFPFNMGWWGFIFPVGKSNSSCTGVSMCSQQ
jgi:tellurite resistance protein TehA-like permease